MTSTELERLVSIGQLHREPPAKAEFEGLLRSGAVRLADARNEELSMESRFDLAYGAAHSLALAALRWNGYRSDNRYIVFQALAHTLDSPPATWRLLAKAHQRRNRMEYEGLADVEERLVLDLITVAQEVEARVRELAPPSTQRTDP